MMASDYRRRAAALGSCQTRGAWFATVCTHPTHVFQGGSCKGEEGWRQYPWASGLIAVSVGSQVRKRLSGGGSEIRTLRPRKRGTMLVETGTVRFQPVSDLKPVFGRSRKHFCLKADLNGAETSGLNLSAGRGLSDAVVYAALLYCASAPRQRSGERGSAAGSLIRKSPQFGDR